MHVELASDQDTERAIELSRRGFFGAAAAALAAAAAPKRAYAFFWSRPLPPVLLDLGELLVLAPIFFAPWMTADELSAHRRALARRAHARKF
jgi:hypothetical protein